MAPPCWRPWRGCHARPPAPRRSTPPPVPPAHGAGKHGGGHVEAAGRHGLWLCSQDQGACIRPCDRHPTAACIPTQTHLTPLRDRRQSSVMVGAPAPLTADLRGPAGSPCGGAGTAGPGIPRPPRVVRRLAPGTVEITRIARRAVRVSGTRPCGPASGAGGGGLPRRTPSCSTSGLPTHSPKSRSARPIAARAQCATAAPAAPRGRGTSPCGHRMTMRPCRRRASARPLPSSRAPGMRPAAGTVPDAAEGAP